MNKLLVFGSCNIDIIAKSNQKIVPFDKNPGVTYYGMGGVGRNIYESILRLGYQCDFATNVGNDLFSKPMIDHLTNLGGHVYENIVDLPTSSFTSILDENNDYYLSISSMDIAEHFSQEFLESIDYSLYDYISLDANSKSILEHVFSLNKVVFADATSVAKVHAFRPYLDKLNYLKCSHEEFLALFESNDEIAISQKYKNLHIIITDKSNPVQYYYQGNKQTFEINHVKPLSTIGAGDCFSGGLLYSIANGLSIEQGIKLGSKMAALTIQDTIAVSTKITKELLEEI